jgi:Lar family restriction alleviation protein
MTPLPMLKRCPFCGGTMALVSDNGRGLVFTTDCGRCGAKGPRERCAIDAADAWNTRADPEAAALAFDLLEGLKTAWRKVDPAKGDDIAAGFARATGGIDVDWLIQKLGPDPEAAKLEWRDMDSAPYN